MRNIMIAGTILVAGILTAGCSGGAGSGTSAPSGAYGRVTTATPQAPNGTITAKKIELGTILVDGSGMTLYLFEKDKAGMSNCVGACAAAWPPLLTDDAATAGAGVKASLLGTAKRPDGKTQVTYHGWPLYHYVDDKAPGDVAGQDLKDFGASWYVVSADKGNKLEKDDDG
jgi:predicted lipoprotein with Yx(FWY)xxD motif